MAIDTTKNNVASIDTSLSNSSFFVNQNFIKHIAPKIKEPYIIKYKTNMFLSF